LSARGLGRSASAALLALFLARMGSTPAQAEDKPVSFFHEIRPILRQNCNGCHHPGKTKGQFDLTTFTALSKGGKHGSSFKAGDPQKSRIVDAISGDDPAMPEEGDPLSKEEIATIDRWIAEGARDDTPAEGEAHRLAAPPIYHALPAISAIAWSPAGDVLAVSGFHEVLLHTGDGSQLIGRLLGESPRIEALAFSADGKFLAVAGGAPSEYGEIQIWEVATRQLLRSIKTTNDSVYGVSFSPDAGRVAVGCADKTVRVFSVSDGKELMKSDIHIDWVFGTAFSIDGEHLVTASRDKALKLIEISTGRLIDDVSRPREALFCLARNPREDLVVAGGDGGALRLFKMEPRGGRLAEGDDKENSFVREFEKLPGPIHSLAYSPDGKLIAAAAESGEARVFNAGDGKRLSILKSEGAIFGITFNPEGKLVALGGADGKVRVFEAASGTLKHAFDSVPLSAENKGASRDLPVADAQIAR
jgi:WD40 repeat protein